MRILVVSNLYPPFYRGGYEIHCARVAEALHRAGNEVLVLTSRYRPPGEAERGTARSDPGTVNGIRVERLLDDDGLHVARPRRPWMLRRAWRELADARTFLACVRRFRPTVVSWWNMAGLSKTLLPLPSIRGIPDVHYVEDTWMIDEYGPEGAKASGFWEDFWDVRWGPRVGRPVLRPFARFWERRTQKESIATRSLAVIPSQVCFLSEFLRTLHLEAGIGFPETQVLHGGVDVSRFAGEPRASDPARPLKLLYASQLSKDRGLDVALDAIAALRREERAQSHLTVVGDGPVSYVESVKRRVTEAGLEGRVSFRGKVPHERMPDVYREHDVLLFTSGRAEGLGFTMVEAMLAGCAVLTTGSGGAREVAEIGRLPTFPPGDAAALATLLGRLIRNRDEVHEIAARGRVAAEREFSFDRMMERWIEVLEDVVRRSEAARNRGAGR